MTIYLFTFKISLIKMLSEIIKYKKESTALWAHHVSVGFIGIELVWRSWKNSAV